MPQFPYSWRGNGHEIWPEDGAVGAQNRYHLSIWRFNPKTVHCLDPKRPCWPTFDMYHVQTDLGVQILQNTAFGRFLEKVPEKDIHYFHSATCSKMSSLGPQKNAPLPSQNDAAVSNTCTGGWEHAKKMGVANRSQLGVLRRRLLRCDTWPELSSFAMPHIASSFPTRMRIPMNHGQSVLADTKLSRKIIP